MAHIVSDDGYGKIDYFETERPLVVITAPGPGSGKMAVCLSQLYHEYKRGVKAGYAKFETFPIWNLPLKHPVNLAYEAATADLNDVNMIDPFHLEAYGKTTVNYNRDVEIFPVVNAMFELIAGKSPYRSPTDMGVNMAGNCIIDDDVCREASLNEIVRRYFKCLCDQKASGVVKPERFKLELLMNQANITQNLSPARSAALLKEEMTGGPAGAMVLPDGRVVTGKTGWLLRASCRLGALYAGADPRRVEALSDFGLYAGIAFQMVDDALDFADAAVTGKPCGGDLREGKFTPPIMRYAGELDEAGRAAFGEKFASGSFSDEEIGRIAADIRERGHDAAARSLADEYLHRAEACLALLPEGPELNVLREVIPFIRDREK